MEGWKVGTKSYVKHPMWQIRYMTASRDGGPGGQRKSRKREEERASDSEEL
jgi:hypothetical protein